jgi:CBS domain-containing protein
MLSNKVREIMSAGFVTAPASSTVREVMEKLVGGDVDAVLLTENDAPAGIFTERHVLKYVAGAPPAKQFAPVATVMTSPVRAVSEETPIVEALGEMFQRRIRHLLVRAEDTQKVVGLVSMRRILRMVVEIGHGINETKTVGEIMAPDPPSVDPTTMAAAAIELMNRRDSGAVMVASAARPVGIFTEHDVLRRVVLPNRDLGRTAVGEVMSFPVITAPESALVGSVLDEMHRRNIRNMPVCDRDGKLAGLVSMPEILQYARALDIDDAVRRSWKEIQEFYDSLDIYTPG